MLFGAPIVVLVLLGLLITPARVWMFTPAAVLAATGAAVAIVSPRIRYRVHRWEVTEDAVYARSGWLWQEWRAAPLTRVQTVDLARGPLQRPFGVATVTVTTASAKGAVRIDALDAEEAELLVQRLTVATQDTAKRQPPGERDAT